MAYDKPIPEPGLHTRPFWDGAKEGRLMLPRCTNCNRVHWYPRLICPYCHAREIEWIEGSGEGRIHTFAVQHRAGGAWAAETPFVTAYIDLNEGDANILISDAELKQRFADLKAMGGFPYPKNQTPWQELYRDTVGQQSTGACLELATRYRDIAAAGGGIPSMPSSPTGHRSPSTGSSTPW